MQSTNSTSKRLRPASGGVPGSWRRGPSSGACTPTTPTPSPAPGPTPAGAQHITPSSAPKACRSARRGRGRLQYGRGAPQAVRHVLDQARSRGDPRPARLHLGWALRGFLGLANGVTHPSGRVTAEPSANLQKPEKSERCRAPTYESESRLTIPSMNGFWTECWLPDLLVIEMSRTSVAKNHSLVSVRDNARSVLSSHRVIAHRKPMRARHTAAVALAYRSSACPKEK